MAFELRTGLENKPWYFGAVVGVLVALGIFLLGNMWLLKPKQQRLARLETELSALEARVLEGRAAQEQLPRFREEVRKLELDLDRLLRILPARRNTPELLRRIRSLTEQGDFSLLRFTPGNFIEREDYLEWPITIGLVGSYHNLGLFFDRVSRFSRIINIEDLSIDANRDQGSAHTIAASFNAKTFVYKEPEPEEAPAEEGAGG